MGIESALNQVVSQGIEYLPELIFALVLLLAGLLLGGLLQFIAQALLRSLGLDGFAERSGLDRALKRAARLEFPLSQLVGRIVFWTVFLYFLASALETVGLEVVSGFVLAVAMFVPRVLGAVLLAVGGLFAGRLARDLLAEDKDRRQVPEAWEQLGKGLQITIVTAAILLALLLLGMEVTALFWLLTVLIAVAGLVVLVGWGPALRVWLHDRQVVQHLRMQIQDGDLVRVGEVEGFVSSIGDTHLALQTTEGLVYLPNALLTNQPLAVITVLPESDLS